MNGELPRPRNPWMLGMMALLLALPLSVVWAQDEASPSAAEPGATAQ
jgi:hypothetical protein